MPIIKGSGANPVRINLGGVNELQKVYLGANLVWDKVTASPSGCVEYGYLYNWYSVNDSRNITSSGWSTPTISILDDFLLYIDSNIKSVMDSDDSYWIQSAGTNSLNFSARGSGLRSYSDGSFQYLNIRFQIWSSELSSGYPYGIEIINDSLGIRTSSNLYYPETGYGIRIVKDSLTIEEVALNDGEFGPNYIGNDDKSYNTVKINGELWLAENLAETLYRNGDPIPTVENATTWSGLTTGAKCAYNNDYTNVGCGE